VSASSASGPLHWQSMNTNQSPGLQTEHRDCPALFLGGSKFCVFSEPFVNRSKLSNALPGSEPNTEKALEFKESLTANVLERWTFGHPAENPVENANGDGSHWRRR